MKRPAALALAAALGLSLAACSPASEDKPAETGSSDGGGSAATETVTFRIWDESAKAAYQESLDAFMAENPDIKVELDVVAWNDYWERLPRDLSSGDMADIFWVNTSNFGIYVDNGNLLSVTDEIGDDHDEWQESITDLYTRDGKLWGVPQLWDSIALFYNKDLVEEAGVDPADLTWAPGGGDGDTLLPAAKKLTVDSAGKTADEDGFNPDNISTFGFNAQADLQAIYIDFLAENGASYQDTSEDSDDFVFASDEGVEAFQYLVDLIHTHHVAPPASETNLDGDYSEKLFTRGELALFQSGPYKLSSINDNADFEWGLAPMVAGPEGRVSVVHGVAAVGNAGTKNKEATVKVMKWLGSAEGQKPLAENGIAFPGVVDAQQGFVDFWKDKGVDVQVFIDAADGKTTPAPRGPYVGAGAGEIDPILKDIFLGATDVEEGLTQAQEAGNAAMDQ